MIDVWVGVLNPNWQDRPANRNISAPASVEQVADTEFELRFGTFIRPHDPTVAPDAQIQAVAAAENERASNRRSQRNRHLLSRIRIPVKSQRVVVTDVDTGVGLEIVGCDEL